MFPSSILSLLLVAAIAVQATNYCDNSLCRAGVQHVACGSGEFADSCPTNAEKVEITSSTKNAIIESFNEKRNFVAGGGDPNHDKACRMATMRWNDDLANVAAYNVLQCQMKHDSCRATKTFQWSGQNLAWMTYYGTLNSTEKLLNAVNMWYNEIKDSKRDYINKYPSSYSGPVIGHFTVMMSDANTDVGCAASTYSETGQSYKQVLIACNFAATNIIDYPIYGACSQAGSGCKTGTNSAYKNLCSTSETYSYP